MWRAYGTLKVEYGGPPKGHGKGPTKGKGKSSGMALGQAQGFFANPQYDAKGKGSSKSRGYGKSVHGVEQQSTARGKTLTRTSSLLMLTVHIP